MQSYDDAKRRYYSSLDQASERYVRGLEQAGLQANDTLTRAMSERAHKKALAEYHADLENIHANNLDTIMRDHRRRLNKIKREGARLRWLTCPAVASVLALCSWYNFSRDMSLCIVYALASLAFLAMLIGGLIFDKPTKE